ncbi:hypothetical protein Nepgr_023016 [Nepenthes gracilis]|uniref:Uncharacterized protein n=1 Tax=Nepenthes gracilis TaxID=150966 RepID=A0AAD3T1U6_NEPGR|nr:hypothetical protein Nepgr_023016 [Nepenthes gracilis]
MLYMLPAELSSASAGADVQPTATHNVFLLMVLVIWMLLFMLLAELGSVSAGADVQPTATHNVFLLMVLSPGIPAIPYQAMSSEAPQLGAECAPDSVDLGLDLHLTADSPMCESENSVILVDAALPAVGIPRTASCPAMMQLCFQQTGLIPVLSVGSNTPKTCLPIGPSYAEILCCGIDADPPGFLVGGEACWPISEEDRIAALGLVVAPLAPVLEPASGLVSYPPGPLDIKTPPSISSILTKYSLDTSYHLGHGSCSPKSLSAASSTDSHLDTSEVSYLGPQAAPSQLDSWQSVKSRRNRKSASKNSKGSRV